MCVVVTGAIGVNWWYSKTVMDNIFPLGLGVCALGNGDSI